jgi:hypothetical protein
MQEAEAGGPSEPRSSRPPTSPQKKTECCWKIFIGITLNLYAALASVNIFVTFVLLIHGHRITLHLFMSSSVSFINVLVFTSWVIYSKHFVGFYATVNGIDFLFS